MRHEPDVRGRSRTSRYFVALYRVLLSAALVVLFLSAIAGLVFIPSGSMEPTMKAGDFLVINRVAYALHVPFISPVELLRWGSPHRSDIVVFNIAEKQSKTQELYIKRVVAVAGDVIQVRNNQITVNETAASYDALPGRARIERMAGAEPHGVLFSPSRLADFGPFTVPKDHVFVMGDNRGNSKDSREWGALPLERVRGKALLRLFSAEDLFKNAGRLR